MLTVEQILKAARLMGQIPERPQRRRMAKTTKRDDLIIEIGSTLKLEEGDEITITQKDATSKWLVISVSVRMGFYLAKCKQVN